MIRHASMHILQFCRPTSSSRIDIPKMTIDSSKNVWWIIPFKKFSMVRVKFQFFCWHLARILFVCWYFLCCCYMYFCFFVPLLTYWWLLTTCHFIYTCIIINKHSYLNKLFTLIFFQIIFKSYSNHKVNLIYPTNPLSIQK